MFVSIEDGSHLPVYEKIGPLITLLVVKRQAEKR